MKFIQLNVNHCAVAQDILSQTIYESKIDVAIISEQYKNLDKMEWERDSTSRSAIWACGNKAIEEGMKKPEEGYARVKIEGIYIYSCYMSPNIALSDFERLIDNLVLDASQHNPIIIGGDFNAWAQDWGSRRTNERGRILLDAFSRLDVILANRGETNTFRRGSTGSIVDLTFVSNNLARNMTWRVSEHYTHSDHQAILFTIQRKERLPRGRTTFQGWASDKLDTGAFAEIFCSQRIVEGEVADMVEQISSALGAACDSSMPVKRSNNRRKENYWWNEHIAVLRKECLKSRRLFQRGRSRPDFLARRDAYQQARKTLKEAINSSKAECFKQLCKEADANPWGKAYYVVMTRLRGKRSQKITCPSLIDRIVEVLFPEGEPHSGVLRTARPFDVEVTEEEIINISSKIGDKKAPGLDGIPNRALKLALSLRPTIFVQLFEKCLQDGIFPDNWKKQKLILIPKPGKVLGEPQSYRPICLLDTIGKCLERIIYKRLLEAVENVQGLSERQYGFRKTKSTIDAIDFVVGTAKRAINGKGKERKYCAVITLDIKNAFNSAAWKHVVSSLRNVNAPEYLIRIVQNYFSNRCLWAETDRGIKSYKITSGVPQGSVLGPLLWNIMYNGIFGLRLPEEANVVGFADDIAVLVQSRYLDEVQLYANETIRIIEGWLTSVNLQLAEHKTEMVLISGRRKRESISIKVGAATITSTEAIKYLGVMIDDRLNFRKHMEYACRKASAVSNALARMMPNIGGPRQSRRVLISRVANSVLLYGSPVWEKSIGRSSMKDMLSVFRRSSLRVCSAFRTVSGEAANVVSGIPPIDITAKEISNIYKTITENAGTCKKQIRKMEKEKTIENWQRRWENSPKGRWTFRLIPSISTWLNRKHGEVNYNLTQFLTGHGGYRSYLHRFGHDSSPRCPQCIYQEETAEHVVFACPRFSRARNGLETFLEEPITVSSIIGIMLRSADNWNAVNSFITRVNVSLRVAEAARRAAETSSLYTAIDRE